MGHITDNVLWAICREIRHVFNLRKLRSWSRDTILLSFIDKELEPKENAEEAGLELGLSDLESLAFSIVL